MGQEEQDRASEARSPLVLDCGGSLWYMPNPQTLTIDTKDGPLVGVYETPSGATSPRVVRFPLSPTAAAAAAAQPAPPPPFVEVPSVAMEKGA